MLTRWRRFGTRETRRRGFVRAALRHPRLDARVIDVVCALIEDKHGRVLACRRGPGRALAGFWEFPGGKLEAGEAPEAALRRELREELACDVRLGQRLTTVEHRDDHLHIRLLAWRCELSGSTPEPREHAELRWVTCADGDQLAWAPADVPVWREWCALQQR